MTITNANGQYIGEAIDLPARPAGPWLTNAANVENPRAALRGRDVREALAGEVPIGPSAEVLAEMANGRRM